MIIKSKYKIARKLGPQLFEKTQTDKFALREGRRASPDKRPRPKSDFGLQLLEKQRARFMYGVNERQFAKYVREALHQKQTKNDINLYEKLEMRLDNVVYRAGLASTRQAARQMVSHGHITVDGKRVTIPSYKVEIGEIVKIREASARKMLFTNLEERLKEAKPPAWIKFDWPKKYWQIESKPVLVKSELVFDLGAILEFYQR